MFVYQATAGRLVTVVGVTCSNLTCAVNRFKGTNLITNIKVLQKKYTQDKLSDTKKKHPCRPHIKQNTRLNRRVAYKTKGGII